MSADQKYIVALARHERAAQAIRPLSQRIGAALYRCPLAPGHMPSQDHMFDEKGRTKTHLWRAFRALEPSICGYGEVHLDPDGIDEYLQPRNNGCRHCLRAWRLIRKRKDARQELGNAKRSIRQLGKSAIAALELIV